MPDTLTPQGRRTRAALIQAAERVFARRGYARTRINDVTAEAAVSVGTFYSYFPSKEAIFTDMVGEYRDRLRDRLDLPPDPDPRSAIRALNLRYLEIFAADPRLWAVLEEAALSMPELREPVNACRREFAAAARSITERAAVRSVAERAGAPHVDPELSALALAAMTEQCAAQWFLTGGADEPLADAAGRLSVMWERILGIGGGA